MRQKKRELHELPYTEIAVRKGGGEFIPFLTALAILHWDDFEEWIHSSFSSNHPGAIHPIILIRPGEKIASAAIRIE